MSNGHRWFKFWPQDWLNDNKLRLCDPATRGVWMDLLCLMQEAGGYLKIDGRRAEIAHVVRILRIRRVQYERCIRTLLEHGVARQTNDGVIYCQRMVEDFRASQAGRDNINKRWNGHDPNRDPNSHPTRGPNRDPNTLDTEADTEAEAPLNPPKGDLRRGDARPGGAEKIRNGAIALIVREGFETVKAPMLDGSNLTAEVQSFLALKGLRHVG